MFKTCIMITLVSLLITSCLTEQKQSSALTAPAVISSSINISSSQVGTQDISQDSTTNLSPVSSSIQVIHTSSSLGASDPIKQSSTIAPSSSAVMQSSTISSSLIQSSSQSSFSVLRIESSSQPISSQTSNISTSTSSSETMASSSSVISSSSTAPELSSSAGFSLTYCISNPGFCTTTIDSRDSTVYRTTQIGTQVWMAENLNFEIDDSFCYDDDEERSCYVEDPDCIQDYCAIYGRLYTWETAMGGADSTNTIPSEVQGICPTGWHIPSKPEWNILVHFVAEEIGLTGLDHFRESPELGYALLASSAYPLNPRGEGTDDFSLSLLNGGYRDASGTYDYLHTSGSWWSTSMSDPVQGPYIYYTNGNRYFDWGVDFYENANSIRCLKD